MRHSARIAVIIPALNEEASIGKVLGAIPDWVDEVIVADNGSTDGTLAIARGLASEHPDVRVIAMPEKGRGRALKRAKVNMLAMSVSEQADASAVRFIVDNERAAKQALDRSKLRYDIRKVVMVRADNNPGILGDISAKLAKEKINIDYAYASAHPDALQAIIILAVDHTRDAVKTLA